LLIAVGLLSLAFTLWFSCFIILVVLLICLLPLGEIKTCI